MLESGVRDIFESGKYADYLKVMSKFHRYSYRNTILIAMQKPEATLVAGFQSWKKNFGRHVKRGEEAIQILAPMQIKKTVRDETALDESEDKEVYITAFRPAYVFDVSQTEGKDIPHIVEDLTGKVSNFEELFKALGGVSPVPISLEKLSGPDGYYSLKEKRIVIDNLMSEPQTLAALVHEISHAMLHDNKTKGDKTEGQIVKDSHTKEVEAESIAYVVCQYFGIETADNSFGYIASWSKSKELNELFSSLETIKETAEKIIDGTEKKLEMNEKYTAKEELLQVCEPSFYLPDKVSRDR